MPVAILHPARDRSIRRRHPWVLSGAVERVEDDGASLCRVVSAEGETLGFGDLSPESQIRVRVLSFGKQAPPDDLVARRIEAAVLRRRGDPLLADTDACRLVNAEGDGLPGLVVDRYGELVVLRVGTAAMHARLDVVATTLREVTGAVCGIARADVTAARREGFRAHQGALWGEAPVGSMAIREGVRRYLVDPMHGQKTGFYLDQRDARDLVQRLASGRRVLDLYAYTGGFSVAALVGGASSVTAVDSSGDAIQLAAGTLRLNGGRRVSVEGGASDASEADAGAPDMSTESTIEDSSLVDRTACALRLVDADAHRFVRDDACQYDLIVVDPPPLAKRAADVERAARAHKDVLLFALRRAAASAHVLAFSCSHHIDAKLLRQIVFGASLDAGVPLVVLRDLGAPSDHAVSLDHPEGTYLHGLWLRSAV